MSLHGVVGTDVEKVIADKLESLIMGTNFAIRIYFCLSFDVGSNVLVIGRACGFVVLKCILDNLIYDNRSILGLLLDLVISHRKSKNTLSVLELFVVLFKLISDIFERADQRCLEVIHISFK